MHIEILTSEFAERYEAFILTSPHSLLYHSWRYQNFLIDFLGCRQESLLAVDDSGKIKSALPLMSSDGCFGLVLNSLPFYGSNGGIIGENQDARELLVVTYNKIAKSPGVAASTVIESPLSNVGTNGLAYDFIDERVGQFTPLPMEGDKKSALMQSFHSKTRNMIRKSEKLGIEIVVNNEALPFLASVHEENMKEIGGLAKPRHFFENLPRYFRPGIDYKIYIALLEGVAVAAVLVFFYNRTAEYYTPVIRNEYRGTQALSCAIFNAMHDAAECGFVWWNWGGTWLSQDGVYRFKSRWGTKDFPYRYFTSVNNSSVLETTRSQLLSEYPFFFTVPFSVLLA